MKRKIPYIIAFCVIVIAVISVVWLRSQPETVKGHVVTTGSYIEQLTGIGYVNSDETRNMTFAIPGDIAKVNVDENMHVKVGDILMTLDKVPFEEDLVKAQNDLDLAKARYDDYIAGYRQSANTVAAARKTQENQISQIELSIEQLNTSIQQTQTLYEEGIATEQEVLNLHEQLDTLTLKRDGAKAQLKQQLYPAKTEEELLTRIETSQEAYDRLLSHESDYVLTAPIDGLIGSIQVNEGDRVNAGESLVTIYDDANRHISIDVDETYLTYLKAGKKVEIYPDAYPEEMFEGVIREIGPLVDQDSGTVRVEIRVTDNKKQLLENMTARVVMTLRELDQVVRIDNSYLLNEEDQWYVLTVDDAKTVIKQPIEIYDANRKIIGVKEGLSAGDIILPIEDVSVGQVVEVEQENGDGL